MSLYHVYARFPLEGFAYKGSYEATDAFQAIDRCAFDLVPHHSPNLEKVRRYLLASDKPIVVGGIWMQGRRRSKAIHDDRRHSFRYRKAHGICLKCGEYKAYVAEDPYLGVVCWDCKKKAK